MFPKPAIEALRSSARPGRGLDEARRGLGEATPRTQNVLAQDKARLIGTRNYMILLLKSSKAELEVVGACAALLEF